MKNQKRKRLELCLALVLMCVLAFVSGCDQVNHTKTEAATKALIFEGTLECLGPDPGITNGILAAYRLAKYRVDRVIVGEYTGSEIVVDHPAFTGKEFQDISVTDRVCVTTERSTKILVRYDADGIRSPSDVVNTYYIAEEVAKIRSDRWSRCQAQ